MNRYQVKNLETQEVEQEVEWLDEISDGHHTMNDLYAHRALLFAVICRAYKDKAHITFHHSNRACPEGKFYVWIDTPKGQYGYHYLLKELPLFEEIKEEPFDNYDGFTDKDIDRLLGLESEKEQAFDIIKNKEVDVPHLMKCEGNDCREYNIYLHAKFNWRKQDYEKYELTQEEFDLLKGVLGRSQENN